MYLCITISDFLKFWGFPWQSLEKIDKDEDHSFKIVPWQRTFSSENPLAYCTSRSEFLRALVEEAVDHQTMPYLVREYHGRQDQGTGAVFGDEHSGEYWDSEIR